MTGEIEKTRAKEAKRLSKADRYNAEIGAMTDQEFYQYADEAVSMTERAKAREPQPVPVPDATDEQLSKLDDAQLADVLADIGVVTSFSGSLSETMANVRRRRGDKPASEWDE